jgi:hypothetical protein
VKKALFWSLTALDILLTAGRFILHWQKLNKIRLDDVFNGIAVVFLVAFMVTWQKYVPIELPAQLYATGVIDTPPRHYDPVDALKNDFANMVVFWCTIYSVKASFLALYWQIFGVSRRFRIAWGALATYILLSFLMTVLSIFWHCGSPATLTDVGMLAIMDKYSTSLANFVVSFVPQVEASCGYYHVHRSGSSYCWRYAQ